MRIVRGASALKMVLDGPYADCLTWLDVGAGEGLHAAALRAAGKGVAELDLAQNARGSIDLVGDFAVLAHALAGQGKTFDGVWCSHTLEHQLNVNAFLRGVHSLLREGGAFAITVPPAHNGVVGGHVTLWNAGLLLYNLVLAGFDLSCDVSVLTQGADVSVVGRKVTAALPPLRYDKGDIETLAHLFPMKVAQGFDGVIAALSWPESLRAPGGRLELPL